MTTAAEVVKLITLRKKVVNPNGDVTIQAKTTGT
jgi:hypothetical protein